MVYYHGDTDNWRSCAPDDTGCLTCAVYPLKRCDIVSKGWRRQGGAVYCHGDADNWAALLLIVAATKRRVKEVKGRRFGISG